MRAIIMMTMIIPSTGSSMPMMATILQWKMILFGILSHKHKEGRRTNMMYMDLPELKALFGEKRVDYLLTHSRIPLAKVDDDLVVMDNLYRLEEELTKDNEDLM